MSRLADFTTYKFEYEPKRWTRYDGVQLKLRMDSQPSGSGPRKLQHLSKGPTKKQQYQNERCRCLAEHATKKESTRRNPKDKKQARAPKLKDKKQAPRARPSPRDPRPLSSHLISLTFDFTTRSDRLCERNRARRNSLGTVQRRVRRRDSYARSRGAAPCELWMGHHLKTPGHRMDEVSSGRQAPGGGL